MCCSIKYEVCVSVNIDTPAAAVLNTKNSYSQYFLDIFIKNGKETRLEKIISHQRLYPGANRPQNIRSAGAADALLFQPLSAG